MASIYTNIHFDNAITVEYDPKWDIHTVILTKDIRMFLSTPALASLHYEIEGSLRHAHEEEGAANADN